MNCIKKFIVANKICVFITMSAIGFMAGMMAAKITVDNCSCTKKLANKAKKAFKTMEDKLSM